MKGAIAPKKSKRAIVKPEDFDLIALAGRGGFGKVWVVRKKNDYSGRVMAMKVMNKKDVIDRNYLQHTILEKDIMALVRNHPFIVDLYFTFQTEVNVYLVMEYLPGGHLLSYVMESEEPWPENKCRFYGCEVLLALEYMHQNNIVYRDLKLENILLDMDGHVRLTDFGLSSIIAHDNDRVHSLSGTAAYIAPEILADDGTVGHGKSVDLWAYGVMLFILLLHESPFYSENTNELFDKILHEEIDWSYYTDEISPQAISLLQGLLTKNVEDRLGCGKDGIQEVKDHPFFATVDWGAVLEKKLEPMIRPKLRVAERVSAQDRLDQCASAAKDDNIFADFSFVAESYISDEDDLSSSIITEDEEAICWPFPVFALPVSIVDHIISYLNIEDLGLASRVCKDWNKLLWTNVNQLDFSTLSAQTFSKYWPKLSKLITRPESLSLLRFNPGLKDNHLSNVTSIGSLEQLSFRGCSNITLQGLRLLVTEKKTMKRYPMLCLLDLSYTNLNDTFVEFIIHFPSLTTLKLTGVHQITDNGIRGISTMKSLQYLELQGMTKITDSGIQHLKSLPRLKKVDLSGCTTVTSAGLEMLKTRDPNNNNLNCSIDVTWSDTPFVREDFEAIVKKKKSIFKDFKKIKDDKDKGKRISKSPERAKRSSQVISRAKSPERKEKSGKAFLTSLMNKIPAKTERKGHKKSRSVDFNKATLMDFIAEEKLNATNKTEIEKATDQQPLDSTNAQIDLKKKKKRKEKEKKKKEQTNQTLPLSQKFNSDNLYNPDAFANVNDDDIFFDTPPSSPKNDQIIESPKSPSTKKRKSKNEQNQHHHNVINEKENNSPQHQYQSSSTDEVTLRPQYEKKERAKMMEFAKLDEIVFDEILTKKAKMKKKIEKEKRQSENYPTKVSNFFICDEEEMKIPDLDALSSYHLHSSHIKHYDEEEDNGESNNNDNVNIIHHSDFKDDNIIITIHREHDNDINDTGDEHKVNNSDRYNTDSVIVVPSEKIDHNINGKEESKNSVKSDIEQSLTNLIQKVENNQFDPLDIQRANFRDSLDRFKVIEKELQSKNSQFERKLNTKPRPSSSKLSENVVILPELTKTSPRSRTLSMDLPLPPLPDLPLPPSSDIISSTTSTSTKTTNQTSSSSSSSSTTSSPSTGNSQLPPTNKTINNIKQSSVDNIIIINNANNNNNNNQNPENNSSQLNAKKELHFDENLPPLPAIPNFAKHSSSSPQPTRIRSHSHSHPDPPPFIAEESPPIGDVLGKAKLFELIANTPTISAVRPIRSSASKPLKKISDSTFDPHSTLISNNENEVKTVDSTMERHNTEENKKEESTEKNEEEKKDTLLQPQLNTNNRNLTPKRAKLEINNTPLKVQSPINIARIRYVIPSVEEIESKAQAANQKNQPPEPIVDEKPVETPAENITEEIKVESTGARLTVADIAARYNLASGKPSKESKQQTEITK